MHQIIFEKKFVLTEIVFWCMENILERSSFNDEIFDQLIKMMNQHLFHNYDEDRKLDL